MNERQDQDLHGHFDAGLCRPHITMNIIIISGALKFCGGETKWKPMKFSQTGF